MRKTKGRWTQTKLISDEWQGSEEEWYKSEEYKILFKKYWSKYNKHKNRERKANLPILYKAEMLLYFSRVRSKQKNIEHDLDKNWILDRIKKGCVKTGLPFIIDHIKKRHLFAPSIDRIDNSRGYTKDNCQLVYWGYNTTKAEFTDDDVYIMAKAYIEKNDT